MVQDALTKVSVELREAVILRDLQDLDYKEIAQVLGIPEGTVKSRISRGRAELARLLERNQEGGDVAMAERTHIPSSPACGEWETLLADALDGLLKPEDEATFHGAQGRLPGLRGAV